MSVIRKKSFLEPDETRTPDKTNVAVVDLGSVKVAQLTVQPGWSWSSCIKPVVGGESCQVHHVGTCVSGQMRVRHDDGTTCRSMTTLREHVSKTYDDVRLSGGI